MAATSRSDIIFSAAAAADERGDAREAFALFLLLALTGDPAAMVAVGLKYWSGDGVPKDLCASMRWDRKAAKLGNAIAMNNLGVTYREMGRLSDAKRWFEKVLATGDSDGAYELARTYVLESNVAEAVRHFRLAIEIGCLSEYQQEYAEDTLATLSRPVPI